MGKLEKPKSIPAKRHYYPLGLPLKLWEEVKKLAQDQDLTISSTIIILIREGLKVVAAKEI